MLFDGEFCTFNYYQVDIVVGTPGRLEDLISTGKLELSACRFFVLDECVSYVLQYSAAALLASFKYKRNGILF